MCQFELFEQPIKIKIISDEGFRTFYLTLSYAGEFLLKHSEKLGLWLYVDGIQTDPGRIRNDIISSAKEIILTRPLVGG